MPGWGIWSEKPWYAPGGNPGPSYQNPAHPIRENQINSGHKHDPSPVANKKPVFISLANFTTRESCLSEYQAKENVGGGAHGKVFAACNERNDCSFVVKVQEVRSEDEGLHGWERQNGNRVPPNAYKGLFMSSFQHEVEDSEKAGKLEIAPEIVDAWTCDGTTGNQTVLLGFIVMKKVNGITFRAWLKEYQLRMQRRFNYAAQLRDDHTVLNNQEYFLQFKAKVKNILTILDNHLKSAHRCGLYHNDLHAENVMILKDGDIPILIDWGFRRTPPGPAFDYQKILIELVPRYFGGWEKIETFHPDLFWENAFFKSYRRIGPDIRDMNQVT